MLDSRVHHFFPCLYVYLPPEIDQFFFFKAAHLLQPGTSLSEWSLQVAILGFIVLTEAQYSHFFNLLSLNTFWDIHAPNNHNQAGYMPEYVFNCRKEVKTKVLLFGIQKWEEGVCRIVRRIIKLQGRHRYLSPILSLPPTAYITMDKPGYSSFLIHPKRHWIREMCCLSSGQ